jgi:hypothetical protein
MTAGRRARIQDLDPAPVTDCSTTAHPTTIH